MRDGWPVVAADMKIFILGFSTGYALMLMLTALFAYSFELGKSGVGDIGLLIAATLCACYLFYKKNDRDFSDSEFWTAFVFILLLDVSIQVTSIVFGSAATTHPGSFYIMGVVLIVVNTVHAAAVFTVLKIGWPIFCLDR